MRTIAPDGGIRSLLEGVLPAVAPELLSPAALRQIQAIPDDLPEVFAAAGFECRLGQTDGRADFHLCIRADAGRAVLANWLGRTGGPAIAAPNPWARSLEFLRTWVTPGSAVHDDVAAVWLEFDLDPTGSTRSDAFVIATLPPRWWRDAGWTRTREEAVVRACLAPLAHPYTLQEGTLAMVLRCLGELPPAGCVAHVAVPGRNGSCAVRLILSMPWASFPLFLERVGWRGDLAAVGTLLELLCRDTVIHAFHIDVGDCVGPRLGCEFHFPTAPQHDPRWQAVFTKLEALGACRPETADVVARWWNRHGEPTLGATGVARDLLIKLDYREGHLEAKAYLPFHRTGHAGADLRRGRPQTPGA